MRAGETLSSIAAQTWGDASLWYVIAEANGLSGSGQVAPGQTLIIPNKAVRTHYNADTFRPYDGSQLVGPTGASKPIVKRGRDCGVLGVVIKMLVTIAVLSIMPTATSFIQGALFGGVANVAAQGVGMMTGIQDGFNWKELGMSAVSGGVAGELSGVKLFDKLGAFSEVGRQAAGGAISQGIAVATGLQDEMDWAGVAMAGVMGGVSGLIKGGNLLGSLKGTNFGNGVANMAGALAAAGAKHIIDGSSFGDNLKSLLPSVVGQTIGDAMGRRAASNPGHAHEMAHGTATKVASSCMGPASSGYGLVTPNGGVSAQLIGGGGGFFSWLRGPLDFISQGIKSVGRFFTPSELNIELDGNVRRMETGVWDNAYTVSDLVVSARRQDQDRRFNEMMTLNMVRSPRAELREISAANFGRGANYMWRVDQMKATWANAAPGIRGTGARVASAWQFVSLVPAGTLDTLQGLARGQVGPVSHSDRADTDFVLTEMSIASGASGLVRGGTLAGVRAVGAVDGLAAEGTGFVGPLIGRSGFRTSTEFAEAVGARYQAYVDEAYTAAQRLEAKGLLSGNPNTRVGDYVDRISARDLSAYLESEGVAEGPNSLVQMNRWLRDPTPGSNLYARPDVRIPAARRIYDATVGFKNYDSTQIVRFDQYSSGNFITIVRPSEIGSYSFVP